MFTFSRRSLTVLYIVHLLYMSIEIGFCNTKENTCMSWNMISCEVKQTGREHNDDNVRSDKSG